MTISVISYSFSKPGYEGAGDDLAALSDAINGAVDTHFPSWEDAAKAWKAYAKLVEEIDGRENELLAAADALALELDNNPAAAAWASCLETANDAAHGVYARSALGKGKDGRQEPFGFSIKFVPGADACARNENPAHTSPGNAASGPGRGA
ncbi:hypothetical protein [Microvirga sesbaniae]|uniref:hypothetical protein n=1 Tax=Microvirga sesbaniae TaxID=681392 RepID=UPI0021C5C00A|nr:hypothetical protein [Microvirga sp. HBU67692]